MALRQKPQVYDMRRNEEDRRIRAEMHSGKIGRKGQEGAKRNQQVLRKRQLMLVLG